MRFNKLALFYLMLKMKSKILFLFFQSLLIVNSFAQGKDAVTNKYWDLLVEKTYKKNAIISIYLIFRHNLKR